VTGRTLQAVCAESRFINRLRWKCFTAVFNSDRASLVYACASI